jgi:hypothetical protein
MQNSLFSKDWGTEQQKPPRQQKPDEQTAAGKRARVLHRLQQGSMTCVQMEKIFHRGQAVVHTLRQQGHIIDTLIVEGEKSYVWRKFEPTVQVSKSMQDAYYATAHWRETARQRKQVDGWRCVQCKCSDNLETHHWAYELFSEDVQRELITLCHQCHGATHEAISGSEVHFPRTVPLSIAEKLGYEL